MPCLAEAVWQYSGELGVFHQHQLPGLGSAHLTELRIPMLGMPGLGQRWSERFNGGFRLQQDRNPIADGVHPLAFVTLQGVLAAQHKRLAAHRAGEYFQQIRADHGLLILTGYCLPLLS